MPVKIPFSSFKALSDFSCWVLGKWPLNLVILGKNKFLPACCPWRSHFLEPIVTNSYRKLASIFSSTCNGIFKCKPVLRSWSLRHINSVIKQSIPLEHLCPFWKETFLVLSINSEFYRWDYSIEIFLITWVIRLWLKIVNEVLLTPLYFCLVFRSALCKLILNL